MVVHLSQRISSIAGYAFAEIDQKVAALQQSGVEPIDFGVGDPHDPPFPSVVAATKAGIDEHLCSGYPSYVGHPDFRAGVAAYVARRFGVEVDPNTQVISSVGSKELVFNLHEAFVDPGDAVIVPNPAYPPYIRGTLFAEGVPYFVNLTEEGRFLPDLDAIPPVVWDKARLIWVCYPNNPTAVFAPDAFFDKLLYYAHKHEVIVGSDEAYIENYYGEQKPRSLLELSTEGVVCVFSLSKMANMTMFRVGFAVGDARIIAALKKLKTNIDSGTPTFVQMGALAALADEAAQEALREGYRRKAAVLRAALADAGFPPTEADGTIYLWQRAPAGYDGLTLATRLLDPDLGLVVTPGPALAREHDGINPAQHHVRFSLTPTLAEVERAAARLRAAAF